MPLARAEVARLIDTLVAERPSFHGLGDHPVNWQLGDRLLRWVHGELPPGARTLETGCGYSTVLFAAASDAHTVVSPIDEEHDRVQAWCAAHDVPTDHVTFVVASSQWWLPAAAAEGRLGALDCVLVDGDHAVPIPAIDWYYTAGALRVGGVMVIDDIAIRTCGDLADFLAHEPGRWAELATVDDATAFRKLDPAALEYRPWNQQPWNRRTPGLDERIGQLRGAVRLRTRLRTLRGR